MAFERSWERQGSVALSVDGGQDGLITVSNVACFKVKQAVVLSSLSQPDLRLQVKKIISLTQLYVGPDLTKSENQTRKPQNQNNMLVRSDVSAYIVADSATIRAPEQSKSVPKVDDIWKAVYEQEPTVALRSLLVDKIGNPWNEANPFPITGTFNAVVDLDTPDKQNIQNISAPTADTEVAITLPDSTKKYRIKIRGNKAKARIAFAAGETATNYWTITRGTVFDTSKLDIPITSRIYMTTNKDNMIIEVISWYK